MTTPVLKIADRCDRCGAQAFVQVTIGQSELLFCGHHFAANESALREYSIVDERHLINAEASVSSA